MRTRTSVLLPTIFALACAGSETAQTADNASTDDPAVVRQAIEQVNADFAGGLKAADPAKLTAHYDAEAVAMPPNHPAARGTAEIQKMFTDMFAAITITDFSLTIGDVVVKEDMAIETGSMSMTMQPKQAGAPAITEKSKYVVVWKKQADGSWKLWRDIFNSDTPLPEPG